MNVTLDKGSVFSVSITGDFNGPYVCLDLSPDDAWSLLQALEAKRTEIEDMAKNYYTCSDCGYTHHKSVKTCPNIDTSDYRDW